MPRKIRSPEDVYGLGSTINLDPPPSPPKLDLAQLDELNEQLRAAHKRFLDLLRSLPIDLQTKKDLAGSVQEALRCLSKIAYLAVGDLGDRCIWFGERAVQSATKLANQSKGPRERHERVQERHDAMDKAIAAGFTDREALFRFMQENHPELIRKGKRDFISPQQMKREHRSSKKA